MTNDRKNTKAITPEHWANMLMKLRCEKKMSEASALRWMHERFRVDMSDLTDESLEGA